MFQIRGKPELVSVEQLRSFLHGSFAVLSYHNLTPRLPMRVHLKKILKNLGEYHQPDLILLRAGLDPEEMLTTALHELIHACVQFPDGTLEKCTSTLCARLKPDVAKVAQVLLDNTYRRAAYIAHTKLSYRAKDKDFYDPAEDAPVGVKTKYKRS